MRNLDRDLIILLHEVARHMRARFDEWARNYDLTRTQAMILVRLERHPGVTQSELAAICGFVPVTAGRLVDLLEGRGYLERRRDPADRRFRRLYLLPASAPVLAAVMNYWEMLESHFTDGLDPGVQNALLEALLHMKSLPYLDQPEYSGSGGFPLDEEGGLYTSSA